MQENNCKYVSSRGIMKSCDIYSQQPISSIRQLIKYNFSMCKNGSTLYICSSALKHFISVLFTRLNCKIILVTGDCDETCWKDLFSTYKEFISFIESEKIIHWFSQNSIAKHPKMTQIPIGLDYHTMVNGHQTWGPKLNPLEQENVLQNIIGNPSFKPFWEREIKCYSNFHFSMKTRFGYDRLDAFNSIPKQLVYYEPTHVLRKQSWETQAKYAFVISPHGNGLDCHRTWEALTLGCIPIVKTSGLDSLYSDLPVLIVKNWSDINDNLLQITINQFKTIKFNYERLLLSYWIQILNSNK